MKKKKREKQRKKQEKKKEEEKERRKEKRKGKDGKEKGNLTNQLQSFKSVTKIFQSFYFQSDPQMRVGKVLP